MEKIKIVGSLFITVLTRIESIWALIILITNNKGGNNMTIQIDIWQYWSFQIISIGIIFTLSYIILNKLINLYNQLKITNIISRYRSIRNFLDRFSNIEYYRFPNESMEQYLSRLPKGQYKNYLKEEYKQVRNSAINELNMRPKDVEKLLKDEYSEKYKKYGNAINTN